MAIVWKEPPPKPRKTASKSTATGRGGHASYVAQLKERPGSWAYFGIVKNVSKGQNMSLHYPGVEYTSRAREDRNFDLYLRWVGCDE